MSGELQRKNDALLKENIELVAELSTVRNKLAARDEDAESLRRTLKDIQEKVAGPIEVTVNSDPLVRDDYIAVRLETDKLVRISADLLDQAGVVVDSYEPNPDQQGGGFATQHVLKFKKNVSPNKTYSIALKGINGAGQRIASSNLKVVPARDAAKLRTITTPAGEAVPLLQSYDQAEADLQFDRISFQFSLNEPAYVTVSCERRVLGSPVNEPCGAFGSEVKFDALGAVSGSSLFPSNQQQTIVVTSLREESEFVLSPAITTLSGKQLKLGPARRTFLTSRRPKDFDFTGPLEVKLVPGTGLEVHWKTVGQTKKAALTVDLGPATVLKRDQFEGKDDSGYKVVVSAFDTLEAFRKRVSKDEFKTVPSLTLEVSDSRGNTRKRELSFALVLPSVDAPGLSEPQREAIRKVALNVTENKNKTLNWRELVELGLPALLAFF